MARRDGPRQIPPAIQDVRAERQDNVCTRTLCAFPTFSIQGKDTATDREVTVLNWVLGVGLLAHVLTWGSPISSAVPSSPDVLLAADCVYFEPAFPLLLQTMRGLMNPSTICYFCFKKRRRADMTFVKMARKLFEVKDVDDDPDKETWEREGVHL
ncbi:MAG: hypothetical protein Q9170_000339 [Blastenia crenularia]